MHEGGAHFWKYVSNAIGRNPLEVRYLRYGDLGWSNLGLPSSKAQKPPENTRVNRVHRHDASVEQAYGIQFKA